jgi:Cdc6-like AAA superfamily ATPase
MPAHCSDEQRADHDRELRKHEPRLRDLPFSQRLALAKIVGYCEGVAKSGVLPEDTEFKLREVIAETLVAFGMPSSRERESA